MVRIRVKVRFGLELILLGTVFGIRGHSSLT